jgi:hypothetical protein
MLLNPYRFATSTITGTMSWVAGTFSVYGASNTTINATTPSGIANGDGLFAFLFTRSTPSPPSGWTLVEQTGLFTTGTADQYLFLYKKDTVSSADSSTSFSWGQSVAARIGVNYAVVRSTTGSMAVAETLPRINPSANVTGPTPFSTTATGDSQIVLLAGSMIVYGTAATVGPSGYTVYTSSSALADDRLSAAYQMLNNGASTASSVFTMSTATTTPAASIVARIAAV